MGGMVLETNMNEIMTRIEEQNLLEKQEVKISIKSFTKWEIDKKTKQNMRLE